ncbi:MAG: 50S ribosomal protein L17 [Phycisphaeraceae bacterium]|nr:50S ribosomal protein L17 [Phycisphaeraceae bacterium]
MRHRIAGFKLGRSPAHRRAMFRNMAIALFTHDQITTTIPKARALRPMIEKLITKAKRAAALRDSGDSDQAVRRQVIRALGGNPILVDRDLLDSTRKELRSEGYRVNKYHELQRGPRVITRLFGEIAERYTEREGGYTRIVKLGRHRKGDGADLCVLMLVGEEEGPQLSGQFSRRRDKANRRAEWASQRRKAKSGSAAADSAETTQAVAEPPESPEPPETLAPESQDTPETPETGAATETSTDQTPKAADNAAGEASEESKPQA